jgi:hypothetical protein
MNGDIQTTQQTSPRGKEVISLYVTKWYGESGRGLDVVPIDSSTAGVFGQRTNRVVTLRVNGGALFNAVF